MAAAIANSLTLPTNPKVQLSSGSRLKPSHLVVNLAPKSKHIGKLQVSTSKRSLSVQAAYSDGGRSGSSSIFVSGFILGGLVVGTLGAVYAPQISKALAGADRKDLMRKLPKFIYDEDKALERTRKVLTEKIAQLNSAIDGVSGQLRSEDDPSEVPVNSDEVEALT